jgi:polysaccharide export outer membrane protein
MKRLTSVIAAAATALVVSSPSLARAQAQQATARTAAPGAVTPAVTPPPGYTIGPDDVLSIQFWREKDMTTDVVVRPDGQISLALLNDVAAAGLTPDQLRVRLTEAAAKYITDPNVTVIVKAINSRRVFITGMVGKPGPYPLVGPTTVLQLIALSGGVQEYAKTKKIVVLRHENGRAVTFPFNYEDVSNRKNLQQNIELKPGDTVIVP